jgi:hypothetical protein
MMEHRVENPGMAKLDVSVLQEGIYLLRIRQNERLG